MAGPASSTPVQRHGANWGQMAAPAVQADPLDEVAPGADGGDALARQNRRGAERYYPRGMTAAFGEDVAEYSEIVSFDHII